MRKKIAIIGSGISGLSVAYFLKDDYEITLYEKNDYYGGHSRTKNINEFQKEVPIDTGFIVFNYETYPNLIQLFELLKIPIEKSDMSFGVSFNNGKFEYASQSLNTVFAQRKNLFRLSFWRMIVDILKFNRISKKRLILNDIDDKQSLGEYLNSIGVKEMFKQHYLLPMGAAIWSTPMDKMYEFPAATFIRFFNNHGLLSTSKAIQWYTVSGGSQIYVKRIIETLKKSQVTFLSGATSIKRDLNTVKVTDNAGQEAVFDKIIFATHSDEALALLSDPSSKEKVYLNDIRYQPNEIYLHSDESYMPKNKKAWASWIYLKEKTKSNDSNVSLSYWMNNLQNLDSDKNYFVTLNPTKRPKSSQIYDNYTFYHPVFDEKAIQAQSKIQQIQGAQNTYFVGAYLRYGFHEDGIFSAIQVAKLLGVKIPWQ